MMEVPSASVPWPPPPTDPPLPVPPGAPVDLEPRRIALVQLGFLGDVVLATPTARALRRRFPDAELTWVVGPRAADILVGNPDLDHAVVADHLFALRKALRDIDLVVDLERSPVVTAASLGVRHRIGRSVGGWRDRALTAHAPAQRAYSAHFRASILRLLGVGEVDLDLVVSAEPAPVEPAFRIALAPFARFATRRWPHWGPLGRRLRDLGAELLVLWGPGEEDQARVLSAEIGGRLIPSCGPRALAGWIGSCKLLIGNDSAPRHLAVSQRVPTITLHGATAVGGWTRPTAWHRALTTDLPCRPCNRPTCDIGVRCLTEVSPEAVIPLVHELRALPPEPPLIVPIVPRA